MKYSIVQINRNTETTCICGSTCEKVSFEVADQNGNVETYGSSCIKSVLGIDTKHLENKRGVQTLKLNIIKTNKENKAYMAVFKKLFPCDTSDQENIGYKVKAKWIIADQFNDQLVELNKDKTVLNYNYKTTKAAYKLDQLVQDLEVGSVVYEKELNKLK